MHILYSGYFELLYFSNRDSADSVTSAFFLKLQKMKKITYIISAHDVEGWEWITPWTK